MGRPPGPQWQPLGLDGLTGSLTFATPGDGDPAGEFAGLLVRLFDSIMLTFRWTMDQGAS